MCFRPGASAWTCPGPRSSTAEATGELSYLKWLAEKHPQQFASLYGRIIPLEMNLKAETPKRVVYPSLDDTRAALRARGDRPRRPGLLIDAAGQPTTEPGVMYNPPFGAILPFGLHKGGGLAVICDLLAGALTGGRTHSPRTIKKDGHDIINNMLSVIIDPAAMGSTELFEDEVETFINWVNSARPQAGLAEVLAPGEPERARRADREKNGVPIDTTTWQQLIEVARKVRLNDTEIPLATAAP